MTSEDMFNTIVRLLEHAQADLEAEYPTSFTSIVAGKIVLAVVEAREDLVIDQSCELNYDKYVEVIESKTSELAVLLKVHRHGKYMQESAELIGQKMLATLGHNKKGIMMSCGSVGD